MADSALTYSLKGRLTFSRSGWLILEVPNSIGNGLFQALNEHGIEQPISASLGRYNAHVSVIRPEEIEQIGGPDKIKARGQMIGFNIGQVREIANPAGWSDVSKVWVANIQSPELMTLRRSLGLGDPKFPFHLTFAIRKKNALNSKQASLIHRTKIAATTTTIQPSPIHGHGLYAARDFSIGDTVVPRFMSKLKGADGRTKYDQSEQCRYTNHANPANCVLVPDGDYVHFVADRDIAKGEELTGDYDTCKPILGDDFDFTYRGRPYDGKSGEEEHGDAGDSKPAAVTHTILSILSTKQPEDRDAVHGGRDHAGDPEDRDDEHVPDHRSRTDSDPDHSGFSKEGGSLRGPQHVEGELLGGVPGVAAGGTGPGAGADSSPERMGVGVAEHAASPIHTFGRTKSAASDVAERGSGGEGGVLAVNRNQIDWGARLKNLRKRRGECPGCGQPFKDDEPYPDVEMCEVCERFGPPKEKKADLAADIAAARDATTEPKSKEQADAGNYAKGKFRMHGLHFSLENPKGSVRSGTDKNGKKWSSTMTADYGYIRGTLGKDGDHVDVFIGPDPETELVTVIDQIDPATLQFDEVKVMFGYKSQADAIDGYRSNYASGWKGLGDATSVTVFQFKDWLEHGDTKKDFATYARKAWQAKSAGVRSLVDNETTMHKSSQSAVSVLRRERCQSLPSMDEQLCNFLSGYGAATRWDDTGSNRCERRLHSGELPLDVMGGATEKQAEQSIHHVRRSDDGTGRLGDLHRYPCINLATTSTGLQLAAVTGIDTTAGYASEINKYADHVQRSDMLGSRVGAPTEHKLSDAESTFEALVSGTRIDDAVTKAANSIYLDALHQTPVTVNPEQGILGNLMSHLNTVKARGDQRITELGSQDRLLNAMDPNRATRQMLSFVHGTRQPIVNHPVDRFLAGELA